MFIPNPDLCFCIPDPGSRIPSSKYFLSRIPDPGSWIYIKEFKYFNLKKWFLSSQKYDLGCSSGIRIPDPEFIPIPDPEFQMQGDYKAPDPRSRIPDPQS
jgi:hypothetical protein